MLEHVFVWPQGRVELKFCVDQNDILQKTPKPPPPKTPKPHKQPQNKQKSQPKKVEVLA